MSKALKKQKRAAALAESTDWMEILRLNKKRFEILSKKINLKFNAEFPVRDPVQRLIVVLRFLVTGEGFHDAYEPMFVDTFERIFEVMEDNLAVSI